jgi:predicted branched-subunit amino acid permease
MVWLGLVAGFLLFMGLIGLAHALDRHAAERFGYRPFALPNLAFMLLPQGAVAATAAASAQGISPGPVLAWVPFVFAGAALVFMLTILWRRTSPWIAVAATGLMAVGAPVLLLSVLFRDLAGSTPGR